MPRYFFNLSFGQRVVPDEEGVELPNRSAARNEALAVIRDLANPKIGGGSRRWASWFLELADDRGRFFPHAHRPTRARGRHAGRARASRRRTRADPAGCDGLGPRCGPGQGPDRGDCSGDVGATGRHGTIAQGKSSAPR